jgi:hypothetical protein
MVEAGLGGDFVVIKSNVEVNETRMRHHMMIGCCCGITREIYISTSNWLEERKRVGFQIKKQNALYRSLRRIKKLVC